MSWWSVLLVEETGVPEKTTDLSQVTIILDHSQFNKLGIVISVKAFQYTLHCESFLKLNMSVKTTLSTCSVC